MRHLICLEVKKNSSKRDLAAKTAFFHYFLSMILKISEFVHMDFGLPGTVTAIWLEEFWLLLLFTGINLTWLFLLSSLDTCVIIDDVSIRICSFIRCLFLLVFVFVYSLLIQLTKFNLLINEKEAHKKKACECFKSEEICKKMVRNRDREW